MVSVTLGRSATECRLDGRCCPASNDNAITGQPYKVQELKDACDGRQTCDVQLSQVTFRSGTSDYEIVSYICGNSRAGKLHSCVK